MLRRRPHARYVISLPTTAFLPTGLAARKSSPCVPQRETLACCLYRNLEQDAAANASTPPSRRRPCKKRLKPQLENGITWNHGARRLRHPYSQDFNLTEVERADQILAMVKPLKSTAATPELQEVEA